jgi:hypothetical protein
MLNLLRRAANVFLVALWVLLYALMIRIFRALKQLEEAGGHRQKETEPSSDSRISAPRTGSRLPG